MLEEALAQALVQAQVRAQVRARAQAQPRRADGVLPRMTGRRCSCGRLSSTLLRSTAIAKPCPSAPDTPTSLT